VVEAVSRRELRAEPLDQVGQTACIAIGVEARMLPAEQVLDPGSREE
jgi:hypothetical protein